MKPFSDVKELLAGSLILAGGQGTRLGAQGPKGCVTLFSKKTLFQILLEKVGDKEAPIAIMTSPLNHKDTLTYLDKKDFFGLKNVALFQQELERGLPNGNGKAFAHFYRSGIWDEWTKRGIQFVQILPIDNPLATPFDLELLHATQGVELALRVVALENPEEKIGKVVEKPTLKVVEYSEKEGPNKGCMGNTGIFSCTMEFIHRTHGLTLPAHTVKKKVCGKWISKKEYFIFDLFPYAKRFKLLVSDRARHFAPLKNPSGPDSFETVARALML